MLTAAAIGIHYRQVVIASVMIAVVWLVSHWLKLGIGRQIIIASLRTVIQLSLIGLVLAWIFARQAWYEVLIILTVMTVIAAFAAKNRVKKPYQGMTLDTLIAVSVSGWLVTIIGVVAVMQVTPWYRPQIIIPILGLILGNALTGISLAMNQLVESLHNEQATINMQLSLSASPWEASRCYILSAIHNGITPTINSMMVVGLVSLPGMMTGQILAGADPHQAVMYQIVTLFLIAASSTIGCVIVTLLVYRRFFNPLWQFVIPPPSINKLKILVSKFTDKS